METVEMDLMQAQIGSLATDVSRLEAKVANAGGVVVEISDLTPESMTEFHGQASMLANEIVDKIKKGIPVTVHVDMVSLGQTGVNYYIPVLNVNYSDDSVREVVAQFTFLIGANDPMEYICTIYPEPKGVAPDKYTANLVAVN